MKRKSYETSFDWDEIDNSMGKRFGLLHQAITEAVTASVYSGNSRYARKAPMKGAYPFIPKSGTLDHLAVYMALHEVLGKGLPKFCDAGCGVGNVMMVAKMAGFEVHGVEYDPRLVRWAERLCRDFYYDIGAYGHVQRGDLLKNPRRWTKFDVVYYYCPMNDPAMQNKFELMLEDNLKVGGFIVAHLKKSGRINSDQRFVRVHLKDVKGRNIQRDGVTFQKIRSK